MILLMPRHASELIGTIGLVVRHRLLEVLNHTLLLESWMFTLSNIAGRDGGGRGLSDSCSLGSASSLGVGCSLLTRNNVNEEVEHVRFRKRSTIVRSVIAAALVVFGMNPGTHGQ